MQVKKGQIVRHKLLKHKMIVLTVDKENIDNVQCMVRWWDSTKAEFASQTFFLFELEDI